MSRRRTALLICWGTLITVRCAVACSCAEPKPPACQEAWRAAAVFAGTVVQIENMKDDQPFPSVKVHLVVTEAFVGLGPQSKELDILTPNSGPACGMPFERGHSYLIYADRMSDGPLRTNRCMRTAPIEKAGEDLEYLHSLPTQRPVGEITGLAFDSQAPMPADGATWPWSRLPNVQIIVHSGQFRKIVTTDSKGRFVVSELMPGNYSVAAASSGYWSGKTLNVSVPAKGCADVAFDLNIDRAVAGRLVNQFGQAVPDITVELVGARQELGSFQTKSDGGGHYEFRRLRAGEYYLGVSLTGQPLQDHPYQRWYHPGVHDIGKALSLYIGQGPKTLTIDLPLPEPQQQLMVNGIVQWPDGRPAPNVSVFPEHPEFPSQLGMIHFTTDENGRFQASLFNGTTYMLYAVDYAASSHKTTSAEPVEVSASQVKEGTTIRLVLSQDGDLVTTKMNRHF